MSFLEAVNEKYGELSPVQKRIADYMYKYPDEACFYSLREMANALGVTEVTVLRFARKLGFDSYVDMKKNLRDHLQARLLGNETLRPAGDSCCRKCGEAVRKNRMASEIAVDRKEGAFDGNQGAGP